MIYSAYLMTYDTDLLDQIRKVVREEVQATEKRLNEKIDGVEKRLSEKIEREASDLGELFSETWQSIGQQNADIEERLDKIEEHAGLKTHKN